jgi:hypothetical protein
MIASREKNSVFLIELFLKNHEKDIFVYTYMHIFI